jgi:hypothetical protein
MSTPEPREHPSPTKARSPRSTSVPAPEDTRRLASIDNGMSLRSSSSGPCSQWIIWCAPRRSVVRVLRPRPVVDGGFDL